VVLFTARSGGADHILVIPVGSPSLIPGHIRAKLLRRGQISDRSGRGRETV